MTIIKLTGIDEYLELKEINLFFCYFIRGRNFYFFNFWGDKLMSIISRVIISSFLGLVVTMSWAMEKQQETPVQSLSFYCSGILATGLEIAAGSFDSLKNTVVNALSDEAAFLKLGWPENNNSSRQELEKCKLIYLRHNEQSKNGQKYEEYHNDCAFINRRSQYCQRALNAILNNTITHSLDRVTLALHCLKYHQQVLNDFTKSSFVYFVSTENEQIKNSTQKTDQDLINLKNLFENNQELLQNIDSDQLKKDEEKK